MADRAAHRCPSCGVELWLVLAECSGVPAAAASVPPPPSADAAAARMPRPTGGGSVATRRRRALRGTAVARATGAAQVPAAPQEVSGDEAVIVPKQVEAPGQEAVALVQKELVLAYPEYYLPENFEQQVETQQKEFADQEVEVIPQLGELQVMADPEHYWPEDIEKQGETPPQQKEVVDQEVFKMIPELGVEQQAMAFPEHDLPEDSEKQVETPPQPKEFVAQEVFEAIPGLGEQPAMAFPEPYLPKDFAKQVETPPPQKEFVDPEVFEVILELGEEGFFEVIPDQVEFEATEVQLLPQGLVQGHDEVLPEPYLPEDSEKQVETPPQPKEFVAQEVFEAIPGLGEQPAMNFAKQVESPPPQKEFVDPEVFEVILELGEEFEATEVQLLPQGLVQGHDEVLPAVRSRFRAKASSSRRQKGHRAILYKAARAVLSARSGRHAMAGYDEEDNGDTKLSKLPTVCEATYPEYYSPADLLALGACSRKHFQATASMMVVVAAVLRARHDAGMVAM